MNMNNRNNNNKDQNASGHHPKPDPETLNTTDPQEHMKGPVSSTMRGTGEAFETDESKDEADRKKEEKM
jgi:hypothetical protein